MLTLSAVQDVGHIGTCTHLIKCEGPVIAET